MLDDVYSEETQRAIDRGCEVDDDACLNCGHQSVAHGDMEVASPACFYPKCDCPYWR